MGSRIIISFLLTLAAASISHAAPLATWDFETQQAGSTPSAREIWTDPSPGNTVMVADATSKPADPFAKGRNRSVYVARPTESKKAAQIQFSLPIGKSPLASGTVSFDLFVVGTAEIPGLIEINLGMLESDSDPQRAQSIAAIQIWTNSEPTNSSTHNPPGYLLSFSGGISGTQNLYPFNEQVPVGKKINVGVAWDAAKGIYSVTLDGRKVSRDVDDSPTNQLPATQSQIGVNGIRFRTANTSPTAFFIDNLIFQSTPGTTR
ncbi:MAG: hypothetical protein WC205_11695 [Opitutaceae bacterium]